MLIRLRHVGEDMGLSAVARIEFPTPEIEAALVRRSSKYVLVQVVEKFFGIHATIAVGIAERLELVGAYEPFSQAVQVTSAIVDLCNLATGFRAMLLRSVAARI